MARNLLALAVTAVLGGLPAVSGVSAIGGRVPAAAAFRLADGSAGCAYADGRIACRTTTMTSAVVLEADGNTRATDVPVAWDEDTPVLRLSESWWHGNFSCRVAGGDLICLSLEGAAIAVGDGRLYGAASPATFALP